MTRAQRPVDLDAILAELGQFGRYQIRIYCFILLPIALSAVYNGQFIFTALDLDYRCLVPECESSPPVFHTSEWGAWAFPVGGGRCERREPLNTTCSPVSFSAERTQRCDAWLYHHQDSIVAEFELACQEWKRTLVGTVHSLGLFAALPITGYVSDTFGRRTALILTATSAGVVGLIRSFSVNYPMLLVLEFLDPTLGSGVYSTGFILALEMVGLKRRVLGGNIISSSFAMGQVLLGLIAWAVPNWRSLTRVLYTPSILFVFYYFVIEESVRWLLSQGNKKEAARIIYKAAAINKKTLSEEAVKQLADDASPLVEDSKLGQTEKTAPHETSTTQHTLAWQVLRSRIIMSRLVICSFWWMTVTFIYYGLSINSVSLAGNMYINYILTSLVEIPGYAISVLTLDRFGRKSAIMSAFFICGIALVSLPFIPNHLLWLATCLNLLGKLCISMAFSSIYIYTSELFPTAWRHRLLAFCSMIGRIGNLVAPQTPLLMAYMEALPYLMFGVMAAVSGLLMLLTPETLHAKLPDTIEQAENIAPGVTRARAP